MSVFNLIISEKFITIASLVFARLSRSELGCSFLFLLLASVGAAPSLKSRGLYRTPAIVTTHQDEGASCVNPFVRIGQQLLLFFSLVAIMAFPRLSSANGDRIAFIVGNSEYEEYTHLANPANDAEDVADRLQQLGFELHDDVVHYNLTERQFRRRFSNFVESATGKKVAFFFFAGHGMQFNGDPHVLPVDVPNDRLNIVKNDAISLNDMLAELDGKAALSIAVFDACREIPELNERVRSVTRGGNANGWRGLSRPKVRTGATLIAYSGGSGQLVADGSGRNSPYSEILLEYLDEERLMQTRFDASELFAGVQADFRRRHQGQLPEIINQGVPPRTHYLMELPVLELPSQEQKSEVSSAEEDRLAELPAGLLDREFYNEAKSLNTLEAYEAYLEEYPEGVFSRIAKLKLVQLKKSRLENEQEVARVSRETDTREEQQLKEIARLKAAKLRQREIQREERVEVQQYARSLQAAVLENWRKPPELSEGISCLVDVTQKEDGQILNVQVAECSGGGNLMRKSVEEAIWSASPLPTPGEPKLFDRQLRIRFTF